MGKGAARTGIDTAGHSGLINTGSFDVFIDGLPAARVGDGFVCPSLGHNGGGVIKEGSSTVLINGKAAARKGDPTMCGELPLPELGLKPKEYDYSSDLKRQLPNDGYANMFGASLSLTDKNQNGEYDTVDASASVFDTKIKTPDWKPFGDKGLGVGFETDLSYMSGQAKGGIYNEGTYGAEGEIGGNVLHGEIKGHIGKEGELYQEAGASADLFYAEANAKSEYIIDTEEMRYGQMFSAGAEAGVVKYDVEGKYDYFGILKGEYKYGGSLADVGASTNIGFYLDLDDAEAHFEIGGKLAVFVGIEGDLSVTLSLKFLKEPVLGVIGYINDVLGIVEPKNGTVLTGSSTVIIGD